MSARRLRRRGQALVEFALTFPLLILLIFGTIEVSRMMSLYLCLEDVARHGAMLGAATDATLSRRPEEVAAETFKLLKKNIQVKYTHYTDWADQPPEDGITVNVNHVIDGQYYTRVAITVTMNFILLPGRGAGNAGWIPITAEALVLNDTQAARRDGNGEFAEKRLQLVALARSTPKGAGP